MSGKVQKRSQWSEISPCSARKFVCLKGPKGDLCFLFLLLRGKVQTRPVPLFMPIPPVFQVSQVLTWHAGRAHAILEGVERIGSLVSLVSLRAWPEATLNDSSEGSRSQPLVFRADLGGNNDAREKPGKSFHVGSGFCNLCLFCVFHSLSRGLTPVWLLGERGTTVHICLLGYFLCSAAC